MPHLEIDRQINPAAPCPNPIPNDRRSGQILKSKRLACVKRKLKSMSVAPWPGREACSNLCDFLPEVNIATTV
jgi:hypothetical protein